MEKVSSTRKRVGVCVGVCVGVGVGIGVGVGVGVGVSTFSHIYIIIDI